MAAVRHCRNVLLGLALLLAPALGMAQQAISPVVFTALNSAQQAQQKGDLAQARRLLDSALEQAPAGSLELALIQQRLQAPRSEEHTSELQSRPHLVCRLLLEKKNTVQVTHSLKKAQTVQP